MPKRIPQVNRLLLRELSALFLKELDFPRGTIVTVKRVETASDCESATAWISVLPEKHQENVMALVQRRIGAIQAVLNRKLTMQFVPKITIRLDESEVKAARVLRLLDKLRE